MDDGHAVKSRRPETPIRKDGASGDEAEDGATERKRGGTQR
jgi:hypothetical protein